METVDADESGRWWCEGGGGEGRTEGAVGGAGWRGGGQGGDMGIKGTGRQGEDGHRRGAIEHPTIEDNAEMIRSFRHKSTRHGK